MGPVRLLAVCVLSSLPLLAQGVVLDCPWWDASIWWRDNRHGFLAPRSPATGAELAARIRGAAPVVRAQLRAATDPELVVCCLIALARMAAADREAFRTDGEGDVGETVPDLEALVRPWLRHESRDLVEGAAIALAIGGDATVFELLTALAADTAAGRQACGVEPVPLRLRAFALYGLGFLARRLGADEDWRARSAAGDVLRQTSLGDVELQVAAVSVLSLLRPSSATGPWPQGAAAVQELERYCERSDASALARAHVPTAVARLWRTAREAGRRDLDALVQAQRGRWLAMLAEPKDRSAKDDFEAQSAALALGETMPDDAGERASSAPILVRAARDLHDPPARLFAILALGRAGGERARAELIDHLRSSGHYEPAWAALALGLLERARRGRGAPDDTLVAALLEALQHRRPDVIAASAIALGLAGSTDRAPLADVAAKSRSRDNVVEAVCDALRMSGQPAGIPTVREIFGRATRRHDVYIASAEARHALGDRTVTGEVLAAALSEQDLTMAVGNTALGSIGNREAVEALLRELQAGRGTPRRRAFLTFTVGRLCAATPGGWSQDLQRGQNWLARVPTLSDRQNGVLDSW